MHEVLSSLGQCSGVACDQDQVVLNNGEKMPLIGLGTAGYTDQQLLTSALSSALSAGYRMIDTADLYSNHQQIAAALEVILPTQGLTRTNLFITTKIRPTDLGYLKCKYAVKRFLEELSTPYLDLVLIHAPHVPPILGMGPGPEEHKQLRKETWNCLQELNEEGLVKSIGVSNYDEELLKDVMELGGTKPQVNQVHMTPFYPQVLIND